MITILDYGVGNLGSVRNMLRRADLDCEISNDPKVVERATKLILPGVGAFDHAMEQLAKSGIREILDFKAKVEKVPVLGICLGMQMLTLGSEEGSLPGLGYIDAFAHRFPQDGDLKVPHMGWNAVTKPQETALTASLPGDARFYFVHSYYVSVRDQKTSMLKCHYGLEFDAGIIDGNIYGTQFHPEKSHRFGRALFSAFGAL